MTAKVIEKITALLKQFSKQHKTKIPETNVRDHGKHQKTANEPEFLGTLINTFIREFDPGSGRTLAVCLTHASRARIVLLKASV